MAKKSGFFDEFKTFISQGSVMDLAVGMVIGAAFTSIVTSLVNDVIMPVVSLIVGGVDFTGLTWTIPNFFGGDDAAVIAYGNFIQNVVNFLVVAFALFLVVRVLNRMKERAKALEKKALKQEDEEKTEGEKAEDEQTKLLKDILKELKKKK